MITVFHRLPPTEESGALFKTILVLFPAVTDYSRIDEAQKRLKEQSIPTGLMVGQFYPGCEEPGIRNADFRPLRSPFPAVAIRHMVNSDLPFLASKAEWIEEYLKRFATSIPASVRNTIAAKFDKKIAEALEAGTAIGKPE